MDLTTRLARLIEESIAAKNEYSKLASDRIPDMRLGPPCTEQQLDELAARLGKPLPPSYLSFLSLHDGWFHFDGDTHLLSVADHREAWVKEKVEELSGLMKEYGEDDPFARGALPIVLGPDEGTFVVLDPRKVRKNGEMDVVMYDLTEEQDRLKDFVAFLQDDLEVTQVLIDEEKNGGPDDDAEEED